MSVPKKVFWITGIKEIKIVQLLLVCIDFRVFSQFVLIWDKIVLPLHLSDFFFYISDHFDLLVAPRPYFQYFSPFFTDKISQQSSCLKRKSAQCIVFIFIIIDHIYIKIVFLVIYKNDMKVVHMKIYESCSYENPWKLFIRNSQTVLCTDKTWYEVLGKHQYSTKSHIFIRGNEHILKGTLLVKKMLRFWFLFTKNLYN